MRGGGPGTAPAVLLLLEADVPPPAEWGEQEEGDGATSDVTDDVTDDITGDTSNVTGDHLSGASDITDDVTHTTSDTSIVTWGTSDITDDVTHTTDDITSPTDDTSIVTRGTSDITDDVTRTTDDITSPTNDTSLATKGTGDITGDVTSPTDDVTSPTDDTSIATRGTSDITDDVTHITTDTSLATKGTSDITDDVTHITNDTSLATRGTSDITDDVTHITTDASIVTKGTGALTDDVTPASTATGDVTGDVTLPPLPPLRVLLGPSISPHSLGPPFRVLVPARAPQPGAETAAALAMAGGEQRLWPWVLRGETPPPPPPRHPPPLHPLELPAVHGAMEAAVEAAMNGARAGMVPAGAAVMDPDTGRVVAAVGDGRKGGHPLGHATMRCLEEVARCRRANGADIGVNGAGGYLCQGWDVILTREPCALCAMALVLARARRVLFGAPAPQGALSTRYGLHGRARLNHRYRAYGGVAPKVWEPLMGFGMDQ